MVGADHQKGGFGVSARTATGTRQLNTAMRGSGSGTAINIETWQGKAECRGPQAEVFFPPPQFERKVDRLQRERRAKKICAQCNVKDQCLEYALLIREPHGIWGGLNEAERRELLEP